jgi:hypothetical protein
MPKLKCPCGYIHNLSPIPDAGWITIRDQDYEEVIGAEIIRNNFSGIDLPSDSYPHTNTHALAAGTIVNKSGVLYECPECGRLIWERPGDENFKVYTLELS